MTYSSLTLPPRMLVAINVHVNLKGNSTEHTYEVKPNSFLMDQYLNMGMIPVITQHQCKLMPLSLLL